MGGGVSKTVLRQELAAVRVDRQELADTLAAREADLATRDRAVKAKDRDARRLRDQVFALVDSKAAMERALAESERKRAATEASLFAITAKSEEDRAMISRQDSKIVELEKKMIASERLAAMQAMTRQQLETDLASSRTDASCLTSSLNEKSKALAACECSLRDAQAKLREEIENGRILARGVIAEADKRVREVQETHADVDYLRAKIVSRYLEEVCGDASQHGALPGGKGGKDLSSQIDEAHFWGGGASRKAFREHEEWQDTLPGTVPWHGGKAKGRDLAQLPCIVRQKDARPLHHRLHF